MEVALAKLSAWDKPLLLNCPAQAGDLAVVKIDECLELAKICTRLEGEPSQEAEFVRLANEDDRGPSAVDRQRAWTTAKRLIKRFNLKMKLVDLRFSLDKRKITLAFVANGRVDFRDLVKELAAELGMQIRLQQIGIRDEAKVVGDHGSCGLKLCCQGNHCQLGSVTGSLAESQGLVGRGNDRLSGACGRLMCCLNYEVEGYKELMNKMPPLGAKVNVDGKSGKVVALHPLKQSVEVEFRSQGGEDAYRQEVDLNRHAKK